MVVSESLNDPFYSRAKILDALVKTENSNNMIEGFYF